MDYELNESFAITNDNLADWALRTIQKEEQERDRIIAIAEEQIADLKAQISELNEKCDKKTSFLRNHLEMYMVKVPHKETKTQETYQLLSGKLVFKKPSLKLVPNEDTIVDYLEKEKLDEYIKIKKSPNWAEFKKTLTISDDDSVINTLTGEVIDRNVIGVEHIPGSFEIKLNKEDE